jgi:hypothetical protein
MLPTRIRIGTGKKRAGAGKRGRHAWVSRLRVRLHDQDEIGPRTLARIAKATGLKPDDL